MNQPPHTPPTAKIFEWLDLARKGTESCESLIKRIRREVRKGNLSLVDVGTSEEELAELLLNSHKAKAHWWVSCLREGRITLCPPVDHILEYVREKNFSLADIGMSEEELKDLWIKSHKAEAHKWLARLRESIEPDRQFIDRVRSVVLKGNLSLADIGTSEKELEAFRVRSHKARAHKWLDRLRGNTKQARQWLLLRLHKLVAFHGDPKSIGRPVRYIREEVREGNLSLTDVGTSVEELKDLRIKLYRATAHMCLDRLRASDAPHDRLIDYVRGVARAGDLSFADIGTSREELAGLRLKGYKAEAREWVDHLRRGSVISCPSVDHILEYVREKNLSLADIGTSEEELSELMVRGSKVAQDH